MRQFIKGFCNAVMLQHNSVKLCHINWWCLTAKCKSNVPYNTRGVNRRGEQLRDKADEGKEMNYRVVETVPEVPFTDTGEITWRDGKSL